VRPDVDVVIVGAGIAGAATAYHLGRRGARGVVVLEKERTAGEHSTGRNAAILREHLWNPERRALAATSAAVIRSGEFAEFRAVGGMIIGEGDRRDEASARCPLADGLGTWRPDDGVLDPSGLLSAFLRGQDVRYGTAVEEWRPVPEGIVLRSTTGEMGARIVVNAAGPWAGTFGRLPLTPLNRHIFVTGPMKEVDPAWPYVWDDVGDLYFRPDSGGLLLSPCDEEPRPPGDYPVNQDTAELLAEKLAKFQPRLRDITVRTCWSGQRTFAPDRQFVIGFDPRYPGLFHVAGLGGHGMTTSYAVGQLAADLILDNAAKPENPFDPGRLLNEAGESKRDR
jgi:D-arginine dehydrogenase